MSGVVENAGERRWSDAAIFGASHVSWPVRVAWVALASIVLSVLLVFSVEWIFRGSFAETIAFFRTPHKPAWTTVAFFVVVLTVAALLFAVFQEALGETYLLIVLAILAMIGVGFLFALTIGFVQIAPRATGEELSRAYIDSMNEGLLVTDAKGRILYANRAYANLTGATTSTDVKTLDALLSDNPEAAPVVERLVASVRDGRTADGEFRLSRPIRAGDEPGARWSLQFRLS